jgi:dTDP-4-amino-4,6-dideoxygalactose transaminase
LDQFVERRHQIAQRYDRELTSLPLIVPWQNPNGYSAYHLYPIRLNLTEINKTQRQIYDALHAGGIGTNLHYIPVYRQPYFESMGFKAGYCSEAERYYKEVLSLPIFPAMTLGQTESVIEMLRSVLS